MGTPTLFDLCAPVKPSKTCCRFCGSTAKRRRGGRNPFCGDKCENRYYSAYLAERLWSRVDKKGPIVRPDLGPCWDWTGGKSGSGYGMISVHNREVGTHKVSYELKYGPVPDGLLVCHKCDRRCCCNPDHFFLGTYKDNYDDSKSKNRHTAGDRHFTRKTPEKIRRGEQVATAKITADQVREIRRRRAAGEGYGTLGKEFGFRATSISNLCARRTWKHVE